MAPIVLISSVHCLYKCLVVWAFLFGSLAQVVSALPGETHRFEGKAEEFTIALPTNWVELASDLVEAMVDPYGEEDSIVPGAVARYGYSPPLSDAITNPPYIAVEVRKTRRLPDRWLRLQQNEGLLRTNLARVLARSGVLERNIRETRYDTNRYMIRVSFTKVSPLGGEQLDVLRQTFFTEEGLIHVMAVCSETERNQWIDSIESALQSFQVSDALRYKPRSYTPVAPFQVSGLAAVFITLTIFVGGPIAYMIYSRRAGEVMSDEI